MDNVADRRAILVLGGARSGKSRYAELIANSSADRVYIATAEAGDREMAGRIATHRARRGAGWTTVEEPLALEAAITANAAPGRALLVDCLTLWLSNVMATGEDAGARGKALGASLVAAPGTIILVSNEVGMGLVPQSPLGRAFRDAQGHLNQQIAGICDTVIFVAAGLPLALKGNIPT
ncbi:MAG: bifunctional adenosylcobinamide kinase/adenosylcobinamide-phosphate guanylyltransferase [Alphaproteobacteria bacterium]